MTLATSEVRGFLAVSATVVLSAVAQILLKAGALDLRDLPDTAGLIANPEAHTVLLSALTWIFAGGLVYVISMLFWLLALTRYDLSLAYPLLSLSYVIVYLAAVLWPRLGENWSTTRTVGIVLIVTGVFFVSRDDRRNR